MFKYSINEYCQTFIAIFVSSNKQQCQCSVYVISGGGGVAEDRGSGDLKAQGAPHPPDLWQRRWRQQRSRRWPQRGGWPGAQPRGRRPPSSSCRGGSRLRPRHRWRPDERHCCWFLDRRLKFGLRICLRWWYAHCFPTTPIHSLVATLFALWLIIWLVIEMN